MSSVQPKKAPMSRTLAAALTLFRIRNKNQIWEG